MLNVHMRAPDGEVKVVTANNAMELHDALVPLMVAGWWQVPEPRPEPSAPKPATVAKEGK